MLDGDNHFRRPEIADVRRRQCPPLRIHVDRRCEKLPLDAWRGRPVLVVNTASFCGYTPQYRDLEALWQRYRERGLVVLGVPSNDFGQQEPGSAAEIKQFCETNYAVDFPLAQKCRVIGGEAHPFYRWVAESLGEAGTPRWNFHKYLIAPDGELAGTLAVLRSPPATAASPARSTRCCRRRAKMPACHAMAPPMATRPIARLDYCAA